MHDISASFVKFCNTAIVQLPSHFRVNVKLMEDELTQPAALFAII